MGSFGILQLYLSMPHAARRYVDVHIFLLTLKKTSKIAADDIFIIFSILFFEENKACRFHVNPCLADDSHEISSLIFSHKYSRSSSAAVVGGA